MSNIKSKSITRNTTCSNLFNSNELEYCCDSCRKKLDIHTITRKSRKNSNKDKHRTNKCAQPWTAPYVSSASRALHHAKVCEYLSIECSIELQNEYKYQRKSYSSLSSLSQTDYSSKTNNEEKSTKTKTSKSNNKTSKTIFPHKTLPSSSSKMLTHSDLLVPLYNGLPQYIDALTNKEDLCNAQSSYIPPQMSLPTIIYQPPPLLMTKHLAPPLQNTPQVVYDEISITSDSSTDSSVDASNDLSSENSTENDSSNDRSTETDSSLFVSVSKSKIGKMERKCEVYDRIKEFFKHNTRTSFKSPLARSIIATGLSSSPALSNTSATTMFACTIQAFLCEIGLKIPIEKVVAACPSKDTFQAMVHEEGIDVLSLMRHRIADKPLFFSCDGANKNIHHVIKMISFWYLDRVLTFLLDSDAAIGDNANTADAANVSLKKLDRSIDGSIVKVKMTGLCTDAGGGGTRDGLATEMNKLERTINLDQFLVVTCCLHAMNLMMCSPCEKCFGSGGVASRNTIQMLYTCYALQKEFEAEEWQQIWYNACNEPFGERFPAPVYTRWEYIGLSSMKFHDKIDGFQKVSKGLMNSEKTASQKYKISVDLYSLLQEPVLITQNLFLRAYHMNFWQPHFQWLKMIDPVSKVSGFASRHLSTRTFLMHQHLQKLKVLWSTTEEFEDFMNRKELHNDYEKNMIYNTLPNIFFHDVEAKFKKHFVQQWLSDKLLPLTLAAIPSVSKAFSRWLLNIPVEDMCITSELHKENIHLPSLINFITKDASLVNIQNQYFFITHRSAILKLAHGDSLFLSDDRDIAILRKYVQENWLPLPSATQLVESKVKDTSFCKSTGKSEGNTSNLAMIRSVHVSQVASSLKNNPEFKNRKRKNENAKDFLHGQQYNVELLTNTFDRRSELALVSEGDKQYSKDIMDQKHHYKKKRHEIIVSKYIQRKDKERRSNATVASGIEYTPLLLGKVQLGTVHNDQRELLIEELRLRGVEVNVKEKITVMKKMLLINEYPNSTADPNEMKFFLPKFLTATAWLRDNLSDTLAMINDIRVERNEGLTVGS